MTVKEHYDNHLGNFYSWYTGDFDKNKEAFKVFCRENHILPMNSEVAIDLGAGNGLQSLALAELGFRVKSIDFNNQLIAELKSGKGDRPIEVIQDDIREILKYATPQPALIVCCGDTLTHLESFSEARQLLRNAYEILAKTGKVVLTFRDYSHELNDVERFIPVKSDSERILTCFIEYLGDKLRLTDLLHERENGVWRQKVSSYYKIRLLRETVKEYLIEANFKISLDKVENRIITLIAEK